MILGVHASPYNPRRNWRVVKNGGEVQALGLPVIYRMIDVEHVHAPDHLIHGAESHLRHVLPDLLRDEEKEIDYVLRLPLELFAQLGILRRDAYRAGIQVALAHHDAAHGDQRSGSKSKFLRAEQRGYDHVAPGLQFAVGLYANAAAQIVEQKNLLRLGQPEFPWNAGMLDRTERRCSGSASVATDENDIRMRFRNPRSDGPHANFRHQLDRNAGLRINVLQVINQLRQILDGINVV